MSFRPRFVVQSLIRLYQKTLSPSLLSTCRFTPTCSDYAVEAIERHGAFKGSALAAWRIVRCNPFSSGGLDVVPVENTAKLRDQDIRIHTCELGKSSGERVVSAVSREHSARAQSLATEPWN